MDFPLSPGWSVEFAVDLVNAAVSAPAELRSFLIAHGESPPITVDDRDVADVAALRDRLRRVFESDDPAVAAGVLNDLLVRNATRPYLTDHDRTEWHLHVSSADAGWVEWLSARTALALALVIAEGGFARLRVCGARECAAVLFDTSRNRTRRFCSTPCATRTRVAAHRLRRSGGDSGSGG